MHTPVAKRRQWAVWLLFPGGGWRLIGGVYHSKNAAALFLLSLLMDNEEDYGGGCIIPVGELPPFKKV